MVNKKFKENKKMHYKGWYAIRIVVAHMYRVIRLKCIWTSIWRTIFRVFYSSKCERYC